MDEVRYLRSQAAYTRVSYRYVDGANCKRFSQMTFRGRLTPAQLKLIASVLDEGLYFVPVQVGFESLHFAFSDFGGDDHWWHTLELGDEEDWTLDAEGYVLQAGDISQVPAQEVQDNATDADTDNLFLRFARVQQWEPQLQQDAFERFGYAPRHYQERDWSPEQVSGFVDAWQHEGLLAAVPRTAQVELMDFLLGLGFRESVLGTPGRCWVREAAPNARQTCVLQPCMGGPASFVLHTEVRTAGGTSLAPAVTLALRREALGQQLAQLHHQIEDQAHSIRFMPAAYRADFE